MTRSLNECELRILAILDDQFVSTSVLKVRAGYPLYVKNGNFLAACIELERRGLAERMTPESQLKPRWRRYLSNLNFGHLSTGSAKALIGDRSD